MNLTEDVAVSSGPRRIMFLWRRLDRLCRLRRRHGERPTRICSAISAKNEITEYMSLYKTGPKVYRAGFAIAAPPVDLPDGVAYEKFAGGEYVRFVLTGPYTDLPQASGKAWDAVAAKKIALRDDFAIENYTKDPRTTPADQLVTEILFPKPDALLPLC